MGSLLLLIGALAAAPQAAPEGAPPSVDASSAETFELDDEAEDFVGPPEEPSGLTSSDGEKAINPIKGNPMTAGLSAGAVTALVFLVWDVASILTLSLLNTPFFWLPLLLWAAKVLVGPAALPFAAWALASYVAKRRVPLIPMMAGAYLAQLVSTAVSIVVLPVFLVGYVLGFVGYWAGILAGIVAGAIVGAIVGCACGAAAGNGAPEYAFAGLVYGGAFGGYIGIYVGIVIGAIALYLNVIGGAVAAIGGHLLSRLGGDVVTGAVLGGMAAKMGRTLEPGEKGFNLDWLEVPKGKYADPKAAAPAAKPAPPKDDDLDDDEEEDDERGVPPLQTPEQETLQRPILPMTPEPVEVY